MKRLIQLLLSGGLLIALSLMIDWKNIAALIPTLDFRWLMLAATFILGARFLITLRWILFLRVSGYLGRIWHLFLLVSAGIGLGSVLPTSLGPDIARGALLRGVPNAGSKVPMAQVVSSLALDRYTATLGTIAIAIVGCALIGEWRLVFVLSALVVGLILLTAFILRHSHRAIDLVTPGVLKRFEPKITAVIEALKLDGMLLRGVFPAIPISAAMTMCRVGMFMSLYMAFGHEVPLSWAMVAIPMVLIIMMLPLSIGGFGVREWSLVFGFESLGIPAEVSVSVGVLSFALQLLLSMPAIGFVSNMRKGSNDG